jgi:LPXTG-site transpeptidase (sortase) family protein
MVGLVGLVPALFSNDTVVAGPQPAAAVAPTQVIKEQPVPAPDVISGHPARIIAPTVGVDMPVVDGTYNSQTGQWTLNDDKAQFASMTTEPNNKTGQTFIYGHATYRVFGKLLNMHIGEQVYVYTANGYKFTYTLQQTEVVDPNNTGILAYTGSPRLLLQTCVGVFSENRKFFILSFTSVERA